MNEVTTSTDEIQFESQTARGLTQWDIWAGIVPLIALLPMLFFQLQGLWARTHMQFFPIVLLAVAWFAWKSWKGAGESTHPARRWTAVGLLTLSMLIYLLGVWKFSPWLAQAAGILVFFSWGLGRFGNTPVPSIAAWSGLLLTTLPLPLTWDVQLIQSLQVTSSAMCGKAMDAVGIPNLRLANVIQIDGQKLFVEEACSGIGSLYALLAAGVMLLILNRRSLFVSVLSILTIPLWAIIGNFLRLFTIVIVYEYYGRDLSHGTDHQLLGMATFLIAAGGFWLTENFLASMFQPVPIAEAEFGLVFNGLNRLFQWPHVDPEEDIEPEDEDDRRIYLQIKAVQEARKRRFTPLDWTDKAWLYRGVVAASALMLLAAIAPMIVLAKGGVASISFGLPKYNSNELELFPGEEVLPAQVDEFEQLRFYHEERSAASNFGQNSLIWEYSWKDQTAALSVDFPFDSWHALSVCYANTGWSIEDQKVFDGDPGEEPWPWEEMEMANELGGKGYVYFCAFTDDMKPLLEVPGSRLSRRFGGGGIVGAIAGKTVKAVKTTYQIQLYFEAGTELEADERQVLREHFLEMRKLAMAAVEPVVKSVNQ